MWDTFCIHLVYILYTSLAYILHKFCIQKAYIIFVWEYKETLIDVIDNLTGHSYVGTCQAQYLKMTKEQKRHRGRGGGGGGQ